MMKKTLILSDIHNRVEQASQIIKYVGADEVISLGDVFDSPDETPETVKNTAEWFVWFVNQPNHIYIAGNHCLHYSRSERYFQCSGYQQWKYFMINDIVSRKDWDKMVYYHILDEKWLLSHGGLHSHWIPPKIASLHKNRAKFLKELQEYLNAEIIKGYRNESWIFNAGYFRGGYLPYGGLIWCDFNEEFVPVKGLNQIVGHTSQPGFTAKWLQLHKEKLSYHLVNTWYPESIDNVNDSVNVDLDVYNNTHWAIWDGEKLSFGNWLDNFNIYEEKTQCH